MGRRPAAILAADIAGTAGDGILAEFPSVIGATECAIEIQAGWPPGVSSAGSGPRRHQFARWRAAITVR